MFEEAGGGGGPGPEAAWRSRALLQGFATERVVSPASSHVLFYYLESMRKSSYRFNPLIFG